MRASGLVTAVTAAMLLSGCTSADDPAPPAPETCKLSLDLRDIDRDQLERLDDAGPLLDRDLRASRSPQGDLCLDIVTDHADPGSTAVSYRIVARQGDQEWVMAGEDPSGQPPLLVDATGCVAASAVLEVLGAGDRTYPYRARIRVGCAGREPGDQP